jgi:HNH endonuclease/NUMOD4 motif
MIDKKNSSFWNEKWMSIHFHETEVQPRYEVSNYGRLRSFQTNPDGDIIGGSKIQGYKSLNIRLTGGKTANRYVHKLVAMFFLKQISPDHKFVIHLDHDKLNNYWENLKWVTRDEMTEHNRSNPNNLDRKPRRTKNYKLTESKVIMIKKLLKKNKTGRLKMIAKQFGITHTQLNRIRSGENWGHVKIDEDEKS